MNTMRIALRVCSFCCAALLGLFAEGEIAVGSHPDIGGWEELFERDLGNSENPEGSWTVANGELTTSKDMPIWTKKEYEHFVLDLEFKTSADANSGVLVYCGDSHGRNWIAESIEIQIQDDFGPRWVDEPEIALCGAIYGHLAPSKRMVGKPGTWNRFTIACIGSRVDVVLNGEHIVSMDMTQWTSSSENPDGSKIPRWLSKPVADLKTKGKIGLQGQHGGNPIWFRNIRISELERSL